MLSMLIRCSEWFDLVIADPWGCGATLRSRSSLPALKGLAVEVLLFSPFAVLALLDNFSAKNVILGRYQAYVISRRRRMRG